MIDSSDGDLAFLVIGGPIGLILAIVLWVLAAQNETACMQMSCPNDGVAKLLDHECVCVSTPKAKQ